MDKKTISFIDSLHSIMESLAPHTTLSKQDWEMHVEKITPEYMKKANEKAKEFMTNNPEYGIVDSHIHGLINDIFYIYTKKEVDRS